MKNVKNKILSRILQQCKIPNLVEILTELQPTDLQSLLLYVFSKTSKKISTKELRATYKRHYQYFGVSELDQREITRFETLFYKVIPEVFRAVELSPIGPFGINAVLTKISQKNVLSTIRNSEIVSDPTIMLALETALRRQNLLRKDPKDVQRIKLCTNQRLLRLQTFDYSLGYMQHFKCFAMCTAVRDIGFYYFIAETAFEHIATYLDLINMLNQDRFSISDVVIYISDIRIMEKLVTYADISRNVVTRNTQNPNFRPFEQHGIKLPSTLASMREIDRSKASYYHIEKNIEFLSRLEQIILAPLQKKYPWVRFGFDLARSAGIGYYSGFCFHIYGTNDRGLTLQLADGGLNDWNQKLLSNKKELLMTSGFGADLVHKMFKKTVAP